MIKNNKRNYRKACQHLNVGDLLFVQLKTPETKYNHTTQRLDFAYKCRWEAGIVLSKMANHTMVIFLQDSMNEITIQEDKPLLILSPRKHKKYFWEEYVTENSNEK